MVSKEPRVTSEQLSSSLTLSNVIVHESTIRRTSYNNSMYGWVAKRKQETMLERVGQRVVISDWLLGDYSVIADLSEPQDGLASLSITHTCPYRAEDREVRQVGKRHNLSQCFVF